MTKFVLAHSNSNATALTWQMQPGYTIVTPSRLAARALHAPHQSLHSLAIRTLERQGKRLVSDMTAQALFRQVIQDIVQPVDVLGTARAWMPGVRSLLKSSPNRANVTEASARTRLLLKVARAYQATLHTQQLLDSAELYWRAAEGNVTPLPVLIYGYIQPQPDELAWINALAADASAVALPLEDSPLFSESQASVNWLAQQGWQVMTEPCTSQSSLGALGAVGESLSQVFCGAKPQNPGAAAIAHAYSTLEAEVRGTLAQVKALLNSGTPAGNIAIVTRDEMAYGPKLIDIAWEYEIPVRALYQTPLLSTRLGAWLSLLVEVLETRFPFEATARLLSHPLASNPDGDFWAAARRQHPQGFSAWQTLAIAHLHLDLAMLGRVNQTRRRDTWVDWWQQVLELFDLRRRCARWARESVAYNRLRSALRELAQPEAEMLTWEHVRQQVQDLLESLSVPAQPGRGGVELHSPMSVAGARYTHVFVIGMAEGVMPAPIHNDPLMDFVERQQLRTQGAFLPTAVELARQESLGFYGLLQTVTQSVVFSYPKLTDRKELLPSPYLKQLGLEITAPIPPAIASPEELRRVSLRHTGQTEDPVLPYATHAWWVEQQRESAEAPHAYDGMVGIPFDYGDWPFSVSQLSNLGQCPFKWFADKLLKLGPPEELEADLTASQIGQLYHRVLELVLAELQKNPALALTQPELLQRAFAIAEDEIIPPNLPLWDLRRDEHLRVLSLTLQDPSFLPVGTAPVALEGNFAGEWHGLKVRGRIDRIDRTEAGLVLIDYKTGKSRPTGIKDQTGNACIDLQLPLYQEAAGPALFPDEPVADAYYYSIRGRQKLARPSGAPQNELSDAISRCKSHLATGHYPVQPDVDRKACTYCNFDTLCRQGDRLSHKEQANGTD